MASRNLY